MSGWDTETHFIWSHTWKGVSAVEIFSTIEHRFLSIEDLLWICLHHGLYNFPEIVIQNMENCQFNIFGAIFYM